MSTMNNRVSLIGYAAVDAEVRTFESGKTNAKFKLATHDRYKNSEGEWQDETQYHSLISWGKLAEYVGDQVKKGDAVVVSGKLVNSSYTDAQEIKRYRTEVVVDEIQTFKKASPVAA